MEEAANPVWKITRCTNQSIIGNLNNAFWAENILTKFRNINRKFFYESAIDFTKPASAFGGRVLITEILRRLKRYTFCNVFVISPTWWNLPWLLRQRLLRPIEPILSIKELNLWLADHIDQLNELNENYHGSLCR